MLWKLPAALAAATLSAALAGCGPASGVTLGVTLNTLFDKVQSTVSSASADAEGVLVEAGSTLSYAIANARADYDEALTTTVDELDHVSTQKIRELERVVTDFTQSSTALAGDLARQGVAIVNGLPLANTAPQITSFAPRWVAGSAVSPETIVIDGNFHSTMVEGLMPALQIGGQELRPAGAITQRLEFSVPASALPSAAADRVTTLTADLVVPYRSSVLKLNKTGTFRILLGVLPRSVGALTVEKTVRETTTVVSEQKVWPLNGASCGADAKGDNGNVTRLCTVRPTAGALLDPQSVSWRLTDARGGEGSHWTVDLDSIDQFHVSYKIVAFDRNDALYLDGKAFIQVLYRETSREVKEVTRDPEPVTSPAWGSETQFAAGSDILRWRLHWVRFDGKPFDYVGNTTDHGSYLRVTVDGQWVRIAAVTPAAVAAQ
jgi:hypothetical protein